MRSRFRRIDSIGCGTARDWRVAVALGGQVSGKIELPADEDWFKVTLQAGETYVFDLRGADGGGGTLGSGSAEAYLTLYDPSGYFEESASNAGVGGDPLMSYVPTVSGQYYVGVADLYDSGTGTYTLRVSLEAESSVLTGTNGDDILYGGRGDDSIYGLAGSDLLNGRAGADKMLGGDGSDTYYVDHTGDLVSETNAVARAGGTDSVYSSLASYTLGANVENGRIIATGAANLIGNGLNNVLYAGAGNNVLHGGAGSDTADYSYATSAVKVNLGLATAQATAGSGFDTLIAIEGLTGSKYNDVLTGSAGNNKINGGAGNDTLSGGAGLDILLLVPAPRAAGHR